MAKLFTPDWILIICNIESGINIYALSIKSKVTYKTTFDYIKLMQDKKLLSLKRDRKQQIIKLTSKGEELQKISLELKNIVIEK
jgi:predicted transcriptional regulator